MLDGLPVVREAFPRTVRLVSSARLRRPVLEGMVSADDLAALAEIEGATSQRLLAQERGADGIGRDEFVYGVPHAAFINAAFAYSKPSEPNRFNASRGAWYAALDVTTCMREVAYHMADFLGKSGQLKGVVEYAELFASMAGEFLDLRQAKLHSCLDPDPAIGYPIGNAIADAALAQGLNGVIYPSVRHPGGTCIAALRPHAVQSVAQGAVFRFEWSGSPEPTITRVSEELSKTSRH
jgi:RES domain-containing protein